MAKTQLFNNEIAQAFVADKEYLENLVYHEEYDRFFIYRNDHYLMFTYKQFITEVYNFIRTTFPSQNVRIDVIKDIIAQIEMLCVRREATENEDYIAFKDVLYNTKTFQTEEKNKKIFTIFYVPYYFSEIDQKIPEFTRFIETSLVNYNQDKDHYTPDKQLIDLVQEMFGFILLGSLKGYKAWFLVGDGANGKGVLTRVIANIIGKDYSTAMTIEDLTTSKYNAAELIGKKVNISNEDESKYIEAMRFKALVSGDTIHTEVKFKGGFNFVPKCKFIFCANRNPIFQNLDYGLQRRIMFIPFKRKFREGDVDKDLDLDDKLELEIPGIIKWAMAGAKRLVENNYCYTTVDSSLSAMKEFEEDIMSAVAFIRDGFIVDDNFIVGRMELYNKYRVYCNDLGKKPYSYNNFKKQIESNIPGIKYKHTTDRDNNSLYGYNLVTFSEHDREIQRIKDSFEEHGKPKKGIRPELSQSNLPIQSG